MKLFDKYKLMLMLKRLSTKELEVLIQSANEENKQRVKHDYKGSMLEHGSFKIRDILRVMFPHKKKIKCR